MPATLPLLAGYSFFRGYLLPGLDVVTIAILGLALAHMALGKFRIRPGLAAPWMATFLAMGGISLLWPPTDFVRADAWKEAAGTCLLAWILMASVASCSERAGKRLALLAIPVSLCYSCLILLQNVAPGGWNPRCWPIFSALCIYLNQWTQKYQEISLLLLMWVGVTACAARSDRRWLWTAVLLILGGIALATGYSKNSMLAYWFSLGVFAFVIISRKYPARILAAFAAGIILSIPLLWFLVEQSSLLTSLWIRVVTMLDTGNLRTRWVIWDYVLRIVSSHLPLGLGFGGASALPGNNMLLFDFYMPNEIVSQIAAASSWVYRGFHPHSVSLLFLADLGIPGLLLYAGFACAVVRMLRNSNLPGNLLAGATAFMFSILFYWNMTFSVWDFECLMPICLGSAILWRIIRREGVSPEDPWHRASLVFLGVMLAAYAGMAGIHHIRENAFQNRFAQSPATLDMKGARLVLGERVLPISGEAGGFMETVEAEGGNGWIARGWAGDVSTRRPARGLLIFAGSERVDFIRPALPRFDVRKKYQATPLLFTGFELRLPPGITNPASLHGVAIFDDETFLLLSEKP